MGSGDSQGFLRGSISDTMTQCTAWLFWPWVSYVFSHKTSKSKILIEWDPRSDWCQCSSPWLENMLKCWQHISKWNVNMWKMWRQNGDLENWMSVLFCWILISTRALWCFVLQRWHSVWNFTSALHSNSTGDFQPFILQHFMMMIFTLLNP